MQISTEQLLMILGQKEVEIQFLRAQLAQIQQEVEKLKPKDEKKD